MLPYISDSRLSFVGKEYIYEIPASLIPGSVCSLAKLHKLPFPVSHLRSKKCFDLVHCDLWGP